jgi:predicted tellurium resistance membrane protein TerC
MRLIVALLILFVGTDVLLASDAAAPVTGQPKTMVELLVGLLMLTVMEIVLGIDNIIFLTILAGKLPPEQRKKARQFGLMAALVTRLMLLAFLSVLIKAKDPLFTLPDIPMLDLTEDAKGISIRDLVMIIGGLFLIYKSTKEIHEKVEHANLSEKESADATIGAVVPQFRTVIIQIGLIDIVFSLDSVITAAGMVGELWVMMLAVILSMGVMLMFAGAIGDFVEKNPSLKVLALSFLILIGVLLTAEGFDQHVNKGYIYFAMAFSVIVEMINLRTSRKKKA